MTEISFLGKSSLQGAASPIDHAIINRIAIASLVPEIFSSILAKEMCLGDHFWFCHSTPATMMTGHFVQSSDGCQRPPWIFSTLLMIFRPTLGISFLGKSSVQAAASPVDHAIINRIAIASVVPEIFMNYPQRHVFGRPNLKLPLNGGDDGDGTFCTAIRKVLATCLNFLKIFGDFCGRGND